MKKFVFEWVIGAAIIILGALASAFAGMMPNDVPFRATWLVVGCVTTTLGGVLISWFLSKAISLSAAKKEYDQQLDSLSRNLGQAAGQITRVVERAQLHELHPAVALELVSQAAAMIYGQVNEIGVLRGSQFDAASLVETARELNGLAARLEGGKPAGLEDVRRELSNVADKLASKVPGGRSSSVVQVPCPDCQSLNSVEIGDVPGDTATRTCGKCRSRFNIHRSSTGELFTRKVFDGTTSGSTGHEISANAPRWSFNCPSCSEERAIVLRPGGSTKINIVCADCLTELTVDSIARTVQQGEKCKKVQGKIDGRSGARPILLCAECGTRLVALMNDGTAYMAFCRRDHLVLAVSHSEFEQWRRW